MVHFQRNIETTVPADARMDGMLRAADAFQTRSVSRRNLAPAVVRHPRRMVNEYNTNRKESLMTMYFQMYGVVALALLALFANPLAAADFTFLPKGFFVVEGEGVRFDQRTWGSDQVLTLPGGEVVFSGPIFPGYKLGKGGVVESDVVHRAVVHRLHCDEATADVEKRFALVDGGIEANVGYNRIDEVPAERVRYRILLPVALVAGRNVSCNGKPVAVPTEKSDKRVLHQGHGPTEFRIPVGDDRELLLRLGEGTGTYIVADCRNNSRPEPVVHIFVDLDGAVLRYRLALVALGQDSAPPATAGVPVSVQARNLLGQGSGFEIGPHNLTAFFRPSWSENWADSGEQPVFDDQVAHSGRTSLRLTVSSRGRRGRVSENMIQFRPVRLEAAKTYSLSAWLRSDNEDMEATLSCAEAIGKGKRIPSRTVRVGIEWARHVLSFTADRFELLNYRVASVAVAERSKSTDGHLWVDDVQLEEGDPTDYQPAPVEFGACIEDPRRIFTPEQAAQTPFILRWRNNGTQPLRSAVAWEITDYWGQAVGGGTQQAELPASEGVVARIPLPALPCGYYRAVFTGDDLRDEAIFGIYQPLALPRPLPAEWPLGCDNSEGTPINSALGFGWTRDWSFTFDRICPSEGVFNWDETDIVVERSVRAGLNLMPVVGSRMDHTPWGDKHVPRWAVERTETRNRRNGARATVDFPRLEAWEVFIGAMVSRYKDRVHAWEILNEPNCWYSADEYLPYLQAAHRVAKAVDPTCTIVGGCATSDWGALPAPWTVRLLELGGGRYMDALSVHMYSNTMPERTFDGGTDRFLAFLRGETRRTGHELPVWHTEKSHNTTVMGYSAYRLNTPDVYLLEPGFRVPDFRAKAEYLIRETLIEACVGRGPFFWFGSLGDDLHFAPRARAYGLHHTEIDGSPCPELLAANGLARQLNGRHLGQTLLKLSDNLYAALFVGSRGVLVGLWNTDGDTGLVLPSELGEVEVRDFFGAPRPLLANRRLAISTAPVYLLCDGRPADAVEHLLRQAEGDGPRLRLRGGPELEGGELVLAVQARSAVARAIAGELRLGPVPAGWSVSPEAQPLCCPAEGATRAVFRLEAPASLAEGVRLPLVCGGDAAWAEVPPFSSHDALRALLSSATEAAAFPAARPPAIDGDLGDWDGRGLIGAATADKVVRGGADWKGPLDLSFTARLRWDADHLYIAVEVHDDVVERHAPAHTAYESDCVEIFLGLDPASRDTALANSAVEAMGPLDFQFLLAPGSGAGPLAAATAWCCQRKDPLGIAVASRRTATGYALEAALPWARLDPGFRPAGGRRLLFTVQATDTDLPRRSCSTTISWAGGGGNFQSPRHWGSLVLR